MRTSLMMHTLIVMLALEWDLCAQDPVIFCYRIGVSLRESPTGLSAGAGESASGAGLIR